MCNRQRQCVSTLCRVFGEWGSLFRGDELFGFVHNRGDCCDPGASLDAHVWSTTVVSRLVALFTNLTLPTVTGSRLNVDRAFPASIVIPQEPWGREGGGARSSYPWNFGGAVI